MLKLIAMIPAFLSLLLIVITGAVLVYTQRRPGRSLPDPYVGRHRAPLLSTAEINAARAAYSAAPAWAGPTIPLELVDELPRGARLPRPRSPWGTPAWVDEWTAEHEPVLSGVAA